ncbi:MAG: hypothetical protein IKS22_12000 [Bacteroidales bacterium]|jgi:hypothetical protein|nr:hypothetical protein [Bacteroidales bacterium]
MKVIKNRYLPFPGFIAMNLFGVVFVREDLWERLPSYRRTVMLRHEAVHTLQMRELGYVGFYFLYFFEWIVRLMRKPSSAYRGISFEREAYLHENDPLYPSSRRHFAQWRRS